MAPIYDSDLAEERWSKDEWRTYELWEQVENRIKVRKRIWILGAMALFLAISSVPLVIDQRPRWQSLSASRHLAQELNRIKSEASIQGRALRIRADASGHQMLVESSESCQGKEWSFLRVFRLTDDESLRLISSNEGVQLGVNTLVTEFCYDPISGSQSGSLTERAVAFAIAPVKDLTIGRTDRVGILTLAGVSAESHFE